MKTVEYIDKKGYKRKRTIRDSVPDREAHRGMPTEPPELSQIDWEEAKKELHNLLMDRELIDITDVRQSTMLRNAVQSVFYPKVLNLYKQLANDIKEINNDSTK